MSAQRISRVGATGTDDEIVWECCAQCGYPIVDLIAAVCPYPRSRPDRPHVHISCFERAPAYPELAEAPLVRATVTGEPRSLLDDTSVLHLQLRRLALRDYLNDRLYLSGEPPILDEVGIPTQFLKQWDVRAAEQWLQSIDPDLAAMASRPNAQAISSRIADAADEVGPGRRSALWQELVRQRRDFATNTAPPSEGTSRDALSKRSAGGRPRDDRDDRVRIVQEKIDGLRRREIRGPLSVRQVAAAPPDPIKERALQGWAEEDPRVRTELNKRLHDPSD